MPFRPDQILLQCRPVWSNLSCELGQTDVTIFDLYEMWINEIELCPERMVTRQVGDTGLHVLTAIRTYRPNTCVQLTFSELIPFLSGCNSSFLGRYYIERFFTALFISSSNNNNITGMGTRRQWPRPRRDRDVGLPRPRRDVCRPRDVTETLKCTFIVTNAVYYLNKLTL